MMTKKNSKKIHTKAYRQISSNRADSCQRSSPLHTGTNGNPKTKSHPNPSYHSSWHISIGGLSLKNERIKNITGSLGELKNWKRRKKGEPT
jgi:hypothetical protein